MVVTGSAGLAVEGRAYHEDADEYVREIVALADLQHEIGVFHCVTQHLARLHEVALSGADAAEDLRGQWGSVKANYSTLIDSVSRHGVDLSLLTQMKVAHDRWGLLAENARACLSNLSMPTETRRLASDPRESAE
jgi:hypothetical protein